MFLHTADFTWKYFSNTYSFPRTTRLEEVLTSEKVKLPSGVSLGRSGQDYFEALSTDLTLEDIFGGAETGALCYN